MTVRDDGTGPPAGFALESSPGLGLSIVRTLVEHETHVRYQEALSASDEKTFCVVGIYEFENRVTGRKCCVICRIEGDKPAAKDAQDRIIHPTGFATWTGPVVNASSVLFPPEAPGTSP